MSTEMKIRAAAEENTRLLKVLSETDYTVSAFQQSTNYLTTLKKQAHDDEAKLRDLSKIVASEYADHKKYRDSHMRRFASKIRGKKEDFEATASKEEKEWLDAVQQELIAKTCLEQLKRSIAEAQEESTKLSEVVQVRHAAQTELDQLYKTVFDGPTPDIPGEDEKEAVMRDAESEFNAVQLRLSEEDQVKQVLNNCMKITKAALLDLQGALDANSMDAWGFADSISAWEESNYLHNCSRRVVELKALYSSAQTAQPLIQNLGPIRVAQMDLLGDVIFDNIFSDLHMRDTLKATREELLRAKRHIEMELQNIEQRLKGVAGELGQAKLVFDEKRSELQKIRSAAFGGIDTRQEDAPPSYGLPSYEP